MLWSTAIIVLLILAFTAWLVVPIVANSSAGSSGQPLGVEGYPSSVSATGDDGRTRTLSVTLENAQGRGLDQLDSGDRLVVTGKGYDPDKGIYVAVCAIPDRVDTKPGPCLGGVPSTEVLDQAGVALSSLRHLTGLTMTGPGDYSVRAVLMTGTRDPLVPISRWEKIPNQVWTALWTPVGCTPAMITPPWMTACRTSMCRCFSSNNPAPGRP